MIIIHRTQLSLLYHRILWFIHSLCKSLHLLTPNSHTIAFPTPCTWATTGLFSVSDYVSFHG